jgi:hypothetical protein
MDQLKNCNFKSWQLKRGKDTRNCASLACKIVADAYHHRELTTHLVRSRRMGVYDKSHIFTTTMDYFIHYNFMEKKKRKNTTVGRVFEKGE